MPQSKSIGSSPRRVVPIIRVARFPIKELYGTAHSILDFHTPRIYRSLQTQYGIDNLLSIVSHQFSYVKPFHNDGTSIAFDSVLARVFAVT